jgi:hypothetical protein
VAGQQRPGRMQESFFISMNILQLIIIPTIFIYQQIYLIYNIKNYNKILTKPELNINNLLNSTNNIKITKYNIYQIYIYL